MSCFLPTLIHLKNNFKILINNEFSNYNRFWTICIENPSFREKTDKNKLKNCYGKLNILDNEYYIKVLL